MNKKGFITTPKLIAIIGGTLVLSGGGYFGMMQYQNYETRKVEKEKQAQESQQLLIDQQKQLEETKKEVEKLKELSQKTMEGQNILESKLNKTAQKSNNSISYDEVALFLTGTVWVLCSKNGEHAQGSGSLWFLDGKKVVLTNKHVVIGNECLISIDTRMGLTTNIFSAVLTSGLLSQGKDFALLEIREPFIDKEQTADLLNYEISKLPFCRQRMVMGSSVVVVGYPASTQVQKNSPRTMTNGTISAYDDSPKDSTIGGSIYNFTNYFVSAQVDSGNSGGIAFSKYQNDLCVLGIPTWVNVGNYQVQGIIQN